MALIKCGECGREISSAAPVCLGCGHPQQKSANRRGWSLYLVAVGALTVGLTAFWFKGKSISSAATDSPLEMLVKAPSPVCRDDGLYNRVISLIVKEDRDGAEKLLDPAIADSQCRVLDAGQLVTLEKGTSLPCVRWNGEPDCWYISPTLVELIP
jgi:hypothetical protein